MELKRILVLPVIALLVNGCALSNQRMVARMAEGDTLCDRSDIEIAEVESYAGKSRYETTGCGSTNLYTCSEWTSIFDLAAMIATNSIGGVDTRLCYRSKR